MKESNYRIHLLYWAIIFVLLCVFMILCVPGRINEDAFSNFSFASVIVSIVLAVISIILSISVGQSTTHYNLEIKDVEKEIQDKLRKFNDLDSSIRSSVESIVKKEVGDVKERQNEMNKSIQSLINSTASKNLGKQSGGSIDLSSVSYLCIASLYIASICNKADKPIPFSKLKDSSIMIVGFLNALSTLEPENLLIQVKERDIFVTNFSSSRWGSEDNLKNAFSRIDNDDIKDLVFAVTKSLGEEL